MRRADRQFQRAAGRVAVIAAWACATVLIYARVDYVSKNCLGKTPPIMVYVGGAILAPIFLPVAVYVTL